MRLRRTRILLTAAVVLLVVITAACSAELQVDVVVDRDGRGTVSLNLSLDPEAQEALGIAGASDEAVRVRFEPLLVEGGWEGDGTERITVVRDGDGDLVLETRHGFDDLDQLARIMSEPRPIAPLAPDDASVEALTDLPETSPILNAFRFRLGEGTGDNPGFDFFARGGVGEIGRATCAGNEVVGFSSTLRNSFAITYRVALPGGPGNTNADDTPSGTNVWDIRYGDCPALTATSGGGGSSTLLNGAILAALVTFLVIVFGIRLLRRRRAARYV